MKKFLSLTLALVVGSFTVALADDATTEISITKSSDGTAKVSDFPNAKSTSVVPITFATDASWDNVKDSYEVAPDVASGLLAKKLSISVGSDGGVSFSPIKTASAPAKSKKSK